MSSWVSRSFGIVAALTLSSAFAVGCGGGSEGSTPSTKPVAAAPGGAATGTQPASGQPTMDSSTSATSGNSATGTQVASAPLNVNTTCSVSPEAAKIYTDRFASDQSPVKVTLAATNVNPKAAYQASCTTARKLVNAVLSASEGDLTDFACTESSAAPGERQNPDGTRNEIFTYECTYNSEQLGAIKYTFPLIRSAA